MSEHPGTLLAFPGFVTAADSRTLLVYVARRGWEMPGGQVELGEDAISALRREVEEESGCRVEPERLIGIPASRARARAARPAISLQADGGGASGVVYRPYRLDPYEGLGGLIV